MRSGGVHQGAGQGLQETVMSNVPNPRTLVDTDPMRMWGSIALTQIEYSSTTADRVRRGGVDTSMRSRGAVERGSHGGKIRHMSDREIVAHRVRNRVIEYLELAASPGEQRRYEAAVPLVHVPNELINQWEDWVHGSPDECLRTSPPACTQLMRSRRSQAFTQLGIRLRLGRPTRCLR